MHALPVLRGTAEREEMRDAVTEVLCSHVFIPLTLQTHCLWFGSGIHEVLQMSPLLAFNLMVLNWCCFVVYSNTLFSQICKAVKYVIFVSFDFQ